MASQPTRGIDVGSIEFVHQQIVKQRDIGVAVLLISAELDEILSLSDRIGVLAGGRLAAEFKAPSSRTEVGKAMVSHE